jgi:hypothetical protein
MICYLLIVAHKKYVLVQRSSRKHRGSSRSAHMADAALRIA